MKKGKKSNGISGTYHLQDIIWPIKAEKTITHNSMPTTPRQFTEQEVRKQFLDHIHYLVDYWNVADRETTKEKLNGLAFSILACLDGESEFPGFIVAPTPHEDDKQYHIDNNENYYPENNVDVECDIAGSLHDEFYK